MSESDMPDNIKKRGLGRGLDAIFGDDRQDNSAADISPNEAISDDLKRRTMPIEWLRPCAFQPRRHFEQDALEDLAKSIVMHGILQPIVVRPIADEKNSYEIIAGERRWRAAQLVQMHTVPVILQYLDDEAVMEVALIENLQREDLTPIEEARAFKKLMDIHGHTQEKLSVAVGKSRSYIANTLRLLNLPENVQSYVADGRLSAGHARSLIGRDNAEELAERIINEDLSVRAIEDLTKDKVKPSKTQNSNVDKDINTSALEEEMSRILGMQVSIQSGKKGNGSLKIKYSNFDQLDHLVHKLTKI
jgi:ParB family chromosome partitioning protein